MKNNSELTYDELLAKQAALLDADGWRVKDELAEVDELLAGHEAEYEATFASEFLAERGADYFHSGLSVADANLLAAQDLRSL